MGRVFSVTCVPLGHDAVTNPAHHAVGQQSGLVCADHHHVARFQPADWHILYSVRKSGEQVREHAEPSPLEPLLMTTTEQIPFQLKV